MGIQAPDEEGDVVDYVVVPAELLDDEDLDVMRPELLDDDDLDFMTLAKKKKKKFFLAEDISTDAISPFAALLLSFCVGSALTFAVFQIRRRRSVTTSEYLLGA